MMRLNALLRLCTRRGDGAVGVPLRGGGGVPRSVTPAHLQIVFAFLSLGELHKASAVCAEWTEAARSDAAYYHQFKRAFGAIPGEETKSKSLYEAYTSRMKDPEPGDHVEALWNGTFTVSRMMEAHGSLWWKGAVSLKWEEEDGNMQYLVCPFGETKVSETRSGIVMKRSDLRWPHLQPQVDELNSSQKFRKADKVEVFLGSSGTTKSVPTLAKSPLESNAMHGGGWMLAKVRKVRQDALLVSASHDMWVQRNLCRVANDTCKPGRAEEEQPAKWGRGLTHLRSAMLRSSK